jgi:hypothetical protein
MQHHIKNSGFGQKKSKKVKKKSSIQGKTIFNKKSDFPLPVDDMVRQRTVNGPSTVHVMRRQRFVIDGRHPPSTVGDMGRVIGFVADGLILDWFGPFIWFGGIFGGWFWREFLGSTSDGCGGVNRQEVGK